MFLYNLKLALTNLANRPGLTILTICAIATGLALLTTMTTMSYQANKIPVYEKRNQLHTVLIDSREKNARKLANIRRMPQLTFQDTINLFNSENISSEKTYLWKSFAFLNSENSNIHPRQVRIMAGLENFFNMFNAPFLYGNTWSKKDDQDASPVIVLSYEMNQYFFGGENSVGKTIRINSTTLTVLGVLARWRPKSRFYDRSFSNTRFDDIFIPSSLAMNINLPRRIFCWEKDEALKQSFSQTNIAGLKASECNWINFWVNLKDQNKRQDYINYLEEYVSQQKSLGRIPRSEKPILLSLEEYIELNIENNQGMFIFMVLAILFFLVCLLNTIGILFTKYMGKVPEIALRRALGAKKHIILTQYLIEITVISFVGGILGILLSHFGLQAMMKIYIYQSDYTVTQNAIRHLYQLDWIMILQALTIAIGSSLVISLFPVWKICNTPPASQLKTQ
ncbi:ABC transporter permease [Aliikangiella sp. IMCC44359]|uniref:ABC transporter permease n=1 Tax=Aliikangiella sp. IMCC44359 TaxID=3459125 RepID=UPI00403AB042